MARNPKRIIVFIITAVLLAASIAAYLLWNKPHKNVQTAQSVTVDAVVLYNQFISDSLNARKNYVEKVLSVSGRIERISVNQQSQTIIMLGSGTPGAYINCTMEKAAPKLKEQDSIIVKGICSGYIAGDADMGLPGDVFLTRCYLTK